MISIYRLWSYDVLRAPCNLADALKAYRESLGEPSHLDALRRKAKGLHFTMGLTQGTAEPRTSHQPLSADTDVPSYNPITGLMINTLKAGSLKKSSLRPIDIFEEEH